MPNHDFHVKELDRKIGALSDALADLGNSTPLSDLLRIIRHPFHTTPAEFAFEIALLEEAEAHAAAIKRLFGALLPAARLVNERQQFNEPGQARAG